MNKKLRCCLLSLVALIPVMALASTQLAKINNTVITQEEFNKKYKDNLRFFQFKAPTKKGVLDDIIKRELGIQQAKLLGLDKDPDVIERMNTVLYHALLDKQLSKEFESIHVSDNEARDYYEKYPDLRTSHIFVALRPDAKPEEEKAAKLKIQKIYDDFVKPGKMSFAEIAQTRSEGVAAPMGGDIDYQSRDKLDPMYFETAMKLKTPGKISEIIRTQFGYHIIKLTAIRPWEEVDKAQVKRQVFEEKRAQIFDKYMAQLRKQAKIEINESLLKD